LNQGHPFVIPDHFNPAGFRRAKEARERLGYKLSAGEGKKVTTADLKSTAGIGNDADRKTLIEKKVDGSIKHRDLEEYAKAVKEAPAPVRSIFSKCSPSLTICEGVFFLSD
jgi:hypothetical protein